MKIQKSGMQNFQTGGVKLQKKDMGPKEQVSIGSTNQTPDFLQKELLTQKADAGAAAGCALLGGATGVIMGGAIGTIGGAIDAGIGWAANSMFGPTGGMIATGVMGGIGFVKGLSGEKGSLVSAAIGGASNAASTYLGAKCGAMGLLYGGLVTGIPSAAIAGVALGAAGGAIGAGVG